MPLVCEERILKREPFFQGFVEPKDRRMQLDAFTGTSVVPRRLLPKEDLSHILCIISMVV